MSVNCCGRFDEDVKGLDQTILGIEFRDGYDALASVAFAEHTDEVGPHLVVKVEGRFGLLRGRYA